MFEFVQVKRRSTCRVCGSPHLTPAIDLGDQYLQGAFFKPGSPTPPQTRYPTLLVRCDLQKNPQGCGLLQGANSLPPEFLYAIYWYRSGINNTMRDHLRAIAESAVSIVPGPDLRVLDIGCNDGTLLRLFPSTFDRIGVDPSDLARMIEPPIRVVNTLYPSESANEVLRDGNVDIVTSIAMFYDLEDPVGFARSIKTVLAPNGIWIVEMSYLPTMLEKNSLDTICHEHLEYYSLSVLDFIFHAAGLRAFNADLNEINGGSIRCYVTHDDNHYYDTPDGQVFLNSLRDAETKLELGTEKPYVAFEQRIAKIRNELNLLLQLLRKEGKSIHVYGASTKGNVLLQWCGIDSSIVTCASDRNPDKHGARTVGTNIPIVSEEASRAMAPDYYLVLPWHFRAEFLRRERQTILNGTKMIFPLPQVTIVGHAEILSDSDTIA